MTRLVRRRVTNREKVYRMLHPREVPFSQRRPRDGQRIAYRPRRSRTFFNGEWSENLNAVLSLPYRVVEPVAELAAWITPPPELRVIDGGAA